ncbi:hypothetical protein [Mesorhizobium sp. IMUNJ 23232]|uniref:hypothetical protein n=1 Tax=Mesorhizobium sp. IMUNJ 23232 TaxID=3376064 RepID=UPI00379C3A8F
MTTPEAPQNIDVLTPPTGMTRAEKNHFIRLLEAQNASGRPVKAPDVDMLCDYIFTRGRIVVLRKMLRAELRKNSDFAASKGFILSLSREIGAATKLSISLADRLGVSAESRA